MTKFFTPPPKKKKKFICHKLKECQIWNEHIENTRMARFQRPLELRTKFIRQFEFLENLEDLYRKIMLLESKVLLSNYFLHTNLLILSKIQTVIYSHSSMIWTSNMAILIFSTCFFHFWYLLSKFLKRRSHDGSAAKGLWCDTVWHSNLIFNEI